MAVENDPVTGNGLFLYVADSPGTTPATVMGFHPNTGLQDIVSTTVTPPYDSLLTPGTTVSTYTSITGLAVIRTAVTCSSVTTRPRPWSIRRPTRATCSPSRA